MAPCTVHTQAPSKSSWSHASPHIQVFYYSATLSNTARESSPSIHCTCMGKSAGFPFQTQTGKYGTPSRDQIHSTRYSNSVLLLQWADFVTQSDYTMKGLYLEGLLCLRQQKMLMTCFLVFKLIASPGFFSLRPIDCRKRQTQTRRAALGTEFGLG